MTEIKKQKHAISPTREIDYPEWYQQVIKQADLAENSPVRGCMVIKPWGYGIWENIQSELDKNIKELGVENAYFPLFIPLSFFEKEAKHVEGFAKECAVVTHHRLEEKEGKLVPSGILEEPLIVRPTSETIIGDSFSRWVESYRDLPLMINQWANVVRWEMRPRMFLRTSEFLWQEGHTVHASENEALKKSQTILEMYRKFNEDVLAIPVIVGEKSDSEKFPGAEKTYTLEAMMQDRKALQGGTSHYLGQNFSKASNIRFVDKEGNSQFAFTTSWGVTTRMIGALIMCHSDDDGLRLPPRISPKQIVILPVIPRPDVEASVMGYSEKVLSHLSNVKYHDSFLRIQLDTREMRGGEKNWEWIKKGIPIRIEIGPRDIETNSVVLYRRDKGPKEKQIVSLDNLLNVLPDILDEIQCNYFHQAQDFLKKHTYTHLKNFSDLENFFTPKNPEKPEIHAGFVLGKWSGDPMSEDLLKPLKVTIRCLPLKQSATEGKCILTGKTATMDAIFAKAY